MKKYGVSMDPNDQNLPKIAIEVIRNAFNPSGDTKGLRRPYRIR